jgi:hypothetical protein
MSSTKKIISDRVLYILAGGVPDASFQVDERDIWKSLEQKINSKYKLQQFSANLPSGETIPDNLCLALYENITVSSSGSGKSKSTLPVMPVSLPRNAGIQQILPVLNAVPSGDKMNGRPMIPLVTGQNELLQTDSLLNDLMGLFGYTPRGITVVYNKDLTTAGISLVDMVLVVFDMSQYGVTDVLPIPADYEEPLVQELVAEFAPVNSETGEVNNFSNAGQQQGK